MWQNTSISRSAKHKDKFMSSEQENIPLEGGYINSVYRNGDHVVKHYIEHPAITTPKEMRFQREIQALTLFDGTISPRLISYDEERLVITMELFEGENLKYIVENGTSDYEKQHFFRRTGELARLVHETKIPATLEMKSDYSNNKRRTALNNYNTIISTGLAEEADINTDRLLTRLIRKDLPNMSRTLNSTDHFSFLHGDFWLSNLIGTQSTGDVFGIIDWEYAHFGMPHEDIAQIMMWDLRGKEQYIPDFFAGYGTHLDVVPFIVTTALEYVSEGTPEEYRSQDENGFIKKHASILKDFL